MGEDIGKAVNVQSWGAPVTLAVTLPLSDSSKPHTAQYQCLHWLLNFLTSVVLPSLLPRLSVGLGRRLSTSSLFMPSC